MGTAPHLSKKTLKTAFRLLSLLLGRLSWEGWGGGGKGCHHSLHPSTTHPITPTQHQPLTPHHFQHLLPPSKINAWVATSLKNEPARRTPGCYHSSVPIFFRDKTSLLLNPKQCSLDLPNITVLLTSSAKIQDPGSINSQPSFILFFLITFSKSLLHSSLKQLITSITFL